MKTDIDTQNTKHQNLTNKIKLKIKRINKGKKLKN